MKYTKVETSTGKIVEFMEFSEESDVALNASDDFAMIEGHPTPTSFYENGAFFERPKFDVVANKESIQANGSDVLNVSVELNGMHQVSLLGPVCDEWEQEGSIELTVNLPGTYLLRISQWPYMDAEVKFNAT